jgi:hypothetical protein
LAGCCGCRTSSRSTSGYIPGLWRSIERPQNAYARRITEAPCIFLHAITSLQGERAHAAFGLCALRDFAILFAVNAVVHVSAAEARRRMHGAHNRKPPACALALTASAPTAKLTTGAQHTFFVGGRRARQPCGFFASRDLLWPGGAQSCNTRKGKAAGGPTTVLKHPAASLNRRRSWKPNEY